MSVPIEAQPSEYELLLSRARTALDINRESPGVEFKASAEWDSLWARLTKTVMAMSNLRDGGIIIIGRPEDPTIPDGISDVHFATYDVDAMLDRFDSHADPRVDVTVVSIPHAGLRFIAIEVGEFEDIPVICKRADGKELRRGALYVRPNGGRPRSTEVEGERDLRQLLTLAADKISRAFLSRGAEIGLAPLANPDTGYEDELGTLANA